MPIKNFEGDVLKWNGATIDFSVAAIGTAFELTLGEVILRRGIKMAPIEDFPLRADWFAKMSTVRQAGESQDQRELLDGIPAARHCEVELRRVHLAPDSFAKWVRTVPRPIRDLCGHEAPQRGRPTQAEPEENAAPLPKKKKSTRRPREESAIDDDDIPLFQRVAALEDKFTFFEALLSTFVGK